MVKLLKNIPILLVDAIAFTFKLIGNIFYSISVIFYGIEVSLHKVLETDTGKKLLDMEKQVENVLKLYAQVQAKLKQGQVLQATEENKLANIIKDNTNVTPLGKKKNDDTKG